MIYCFDLDGTICSPVVGSAYVDAQPDKIVVDEINRLFEAGHEILIMTARGCVSGIDHTELTKDQLLRWEVKYHRLIMGVKPNADIFVDDKGISIQEWKNNLPIKYGVLAGAFDIIHPGYIRMFKEAKLNCTHLTVLLNICPENKMVPVQTVGERIEILSSIRYVDNVIIYSSEEDLYWRLKLNSYDIRFLGSDYIDKHFTGIDLNIPIHYIERNHGYSTTELKERIFNSINENYKQRINGDLL